MRSLAFLACLIGALASSHALAQAPCRLALVLALDVSGSVDAEEYRQQLDGLATALERPSVQAAILEGGATVQLAAFEWSSQNHQFLVLPWTELADTASIGRAADQIRSYRKQRAGLKTALSTAMLFAAEMLMSKAECWRRTVDVSGDGENNIGPTMAEVYRLSVFDGVTINALAVTKASRNTGSDRRAAAEAMRKYFEQEVIRGVGAFAMVADGYSDYARAMERKLLREVSLPTLGGASNAVGRQARLHDERPGAR